MLAACLNQSTSQSHAHRHSCPFLPLHTSTALLLLLPASCRHCCYLCPPHCCFIRLLLCLPVGQLRAQLSHVHTCCTVDGLLVGWQGGAAATKAARHRRHTPCVNGPSRHNTWPCNSGQTAPLPLIWAGYSHTAYVHEAISCGQTAPLTLTGMLDQSLQDCTYE
jgi:hypothetical protein